MWYPNSYAPFYDGDQRDSSSKICLLVIISFSYHYILTLRGVTSAGPVEVVDEVTGGLKLL